MPKNFAIIGVGGYIDPRHLRGIRDMGNQLLAAVDPKDSVGVLDQYSFDVKFFTEIERFDRHLEKLRRGIELERIHFVSICSPNYLHDAHCRLALHVGYRVWDFPHTEKASQETLSLPPYPELTVSQQDVVIGVVWELWVDRILLSCENSETEFSNGY